MSNEELLAEAKLRFPNGTKYYPAHLPRKDKYKCIVENSNNFRFETKNSGTIIESNGDFIKNKHYYSDCVYYNDIWAEIVSIPKLEFLYF